MSTAKTMSDFWNARARENAPHYIATWAADYEQPDLATFFVSGEEDVRRLLAEIAYTPRPDASMLEIGCGIGRMTRAFATRFGTVNAIDISEDMIAQAKAHLADCPNVRLAVSNGTDLAIFTDASLDFCFSYIVFQHIPDPAITYRYIAEIGRVLKPGGTAYFQVDTRPRPFDGVRARLKIRARLKRLAGGPDYASAAWRGSSVDPETLKATIARAGMQLQRLDGVGVQYTMVVCHKP